MRLYSAGLFGTWKIRIPYWQVHLVRGNLGDPMGQVYFVLGILGSHIGRFIWHVEF